MKDRSLKLRWVVVGIAVLALAALACGAVVDPTPEPPTPAPPTAIPPSPIPPTAAPTKDTTGTTAGNVNLAVINQTKTEICYLYVTKSESDDWGPDQLGDTETIAVGSTFTVTNIPSGSFDILSEDCDHNVISWNYLVDLTGQIDFNLTVSGAPDVLEVQNDTSTQICSVYISPPNATSWGRSQLNPDHPIEPGTKRTIVIGPGTWDLRAESCDGQSAERLGETIDQGVTTWTLN